MHPLTRCDHLPTVRAAMPPRSRRRQSLNAGQKTQMSLETAKQTGFMLIFNAALVALTIFSYTGFGVMGWTEFTVTPGLYLDKSGNITSSSKKGFDKTLNFVKDEYPLLTIKDVRPLQRKWFDDNYYYNITTGLPLSTLVTDEDGKVEPMLGREKNVFFKVMPAYQQATVIDVKRKDDGTRAYTEHKHGWQATVTFRTSMWDEGTSCYNPYTLDDLGDDVNPSKFDGLYPSDLGDIVHFYGNQFRPVLSDETDSDGFYYIKYIKYNDTKCMYLYRAYFLGAAGMSFSVIGGATALLFAMLVWAHNDKNKYRPAPLNPKWRSCCAQISYYCASIWVFLKKRGPQIIGFTCAISSALQGIFVLLSIAQMAGFHGHWYYFTMPWYIMGIVGFLDLYAYARMVNIIHDFYVKGRRLRLQNVPEGLWARKVECGGPEGFKEETRLGMSLAKIGNEIVVTNVRGFAKTKGSNHDNEDEIDVSPYYANNVQVGDVFLGIMTVSTLTVRAPKSEEEKAQHEKILDAWDPDRLIFKEDSEFVGGSLSNEEYVMLQKPWKWRNLRSHKVYQFLEPHVNPSVEDAERLLRKAKEEANPKEEGIVGKPYWILTWRVNEEGIKKAQFPVPTACTPEEFKLLEYKSSPFLIRHETLDDYTTNLGLDLEDLNPTRTVEMHIETQGVVILSTEGLSESLGLRADDVIVGVNYTPLTKAMTSTKLEGIIAEMPLPFVLNVSRKVKDYVPDSLDIEKKKQNSRDELARFNKLLILLGLLVAGLALSVTASSSTEWTVYGRDPTSLADYGIGIWFAAIAKGLHRSDNFQMALDRLIYCGDVLSDGSEHSSAESGFQSCATSRGSMYEGTDIFQMKMFTRACTITAVVFGMVGCFLITLLLLVGIDVVSPKIRRRYVTCASVSSLLQSVLSLVAAYCWTYIHDSFINRDDNCLVEYVDGTIDWVPRQNGVAVTEKEYHDGAQYEHNGAPLCMAYFRYGPAFMALVFAGVFTFLLSVDSLLSFTVYEDNLTVREKMEIAKAKMKKKEKMAKFDALAAQNENVDHSFLSPGADKLVGTLGSAVPTASMKDLGNIASEDVHKAGEAMAKMGSSLKKMSSFRVKSPKSDGI
mmetsp:Transcript_5916/g.14224  ORF Transcript_5916/g.14224 Transcript_5916/m.14224 type:complete len:1107 (-) Transcript_5916:181-3501(-)